MEREPHDPTEGQEVNRVAAFYESPEAALERLIPEIEPAVPTPPDVVLTEDLQTKYAFFLDHPDRLDVGKEILRIYATLGDQRKVGEWAAYLIQQSPGDTELLPYLQGGSQSDPGGF